MAKSIGLMMALAGLATLAGAQVTPDPLEACYQQPDGAPRLACFNTEMQRRHGVAATAAAAPVVPAARTAADDSVGLQGGALRRKLKQEAVQLVQPIVASVVRVVARAHSESAFVLDNGQTWEQVEVVDNLNVRQHDTVTIRPGVLGSFFLSTPKSPRVRVRRIV